MGCVAVANGESTNKNKPRCGRAVSSSLFGKQNKKEESDINGKDDVTDVEKKNSIDRHLSVFKVKHYPIIICS